MATRITPGGGVYRCTGDKRPRRGQEPACKYLGYVIRRDPEEGGGWQGYRDTGGGRATPAGPPRRLRRTAATDIVRRKG